MVLPQRRKDSLKDSSTRAPQFNNTSPPRRKDSDRLPSLPSQPEDGYEKVEPPQRTKKPSPVSPLTGVDQSSHVSGGPPPRPHKPSELSNTLVSDIGPCTPQQIVPPVRPSRSSSSSSSPYETVEIVSRKREGSKGGSVGERTPPRPPKPGSGVIEDDSSSIYMQPPIPVSVISPIDDSDIYDNVHIKNIPLGATDGLHGVSTLGAKDGVAEACTGETNEPTVLGGSAGERKESVDIGNEIASSGTQETKGDATNITERESTDGNLEIDSGGMGCESLAQAIEERRQVLQEEEAKEGVVLLSKQMLNEKGSDLSHTYGM